MKKVIPVMPDGRGPEVRLLHEALERIALEGGSALFTEAYDKVHLFQSSFKWEDDNNLYGKSTIDLVKDFQKYIMNLEPTGLVDNATADAINNLLESIENLKSKNAAPKNNVKQEQAEKNYIVSGQVLNSYGEPLYEQEVLAAEVNLRGVAIYKTATMVEDLKANHGFIFLGNAQTDINGNYKISFTSESLPRHEKKLADVVAYAIDTNKNIIGYSTLATAKNFTDGTEINNLNINTSISDIRGVSEYARLMKVLIPFVEKSDLFLYQLSGSADQINFLATETNQNINNTSLAVQADQLSHDFPDYHFEKELFYGIGRQKITLTWASLFLKKQTDLLNGIQASIAQNIIKPYSSDAINTFLKDVSDVSADYAMTTAPETANLSKIMGLALSDNTTLQKTFLQLYTNYTGTPNDFWTNYLPNKGFGVTEIASLQLTNQVSILTGQNVPLMEAILVTKQGTQPITQASELLSLDWNSLIATAGVPAGVTGSTPAEQATNYITGIQNLLNAAFPTQKIAQLITQPQSPFQFKDNVINFFNNLPAGFDISSSSIAALNLSDKDLNNQLCSIQRIYQVSPTPDAMSYLMNKGFASAMDIVNVPQQAFVDTHGTNLGGAVIALSIHNRAVHQYLRNQHILLTSRDVTSSALPATLISNSDRGTLQQTIQPIIAPNNPVTDVFGISSYCECSDCLSIYSPAAYLVDIMQYLGSLNSNTANVSVLGVLLQRRPDIANLLLTCANTNTEIPFIDLVNEIMEYYVANINSTTPLTASIATKLPAHDTGNATSDELSIEPQYTIINAYKNVYAQYYPFTLPYHQPLDVIRTYLNFLKTSRAELMEIFPYYIANPFIPTLSPIPQAAIDAEIMQLSLKEYEILTSQDFFGNPVPPQTIESYYGNPSPVYTGNPIPVTGFLLCTGLQYTDLVGIMETQFINPGQGILNVLQTLLSNTPQSLGINQNTFYTDLQSIVSLTANSQNETDIQNILYYQTPPITFSAFSSWVRQNWNAFNNIITLFDGLDDCNITNTYLDSIYWIYNPVSPNTPNTASTPDDNITEGFLSKMHRFIRLWQKTGWAIHELDNMIIAVGETDITPLLINKLATVNKINVILNLPLLQLACLWGDIDTYGDSSLYVQLFLSNSGNEADSTGTSLNNNPFAPDPLGNIFNSGANLLLTDKSVFTTILSAIKISAQDFNTIINDSGLVSTATISIENLSIIYRYQLLSSTLNISISDLCTIKNLFGINPFGFFTEVNTGTSSNSKSTLVVSFVSPKPTVTGSVTNSSPIITLSVNSSVITNVNFGIGDFISIDEVIYQIISIPTGLTTSIITFNLGSNFGGATNANLAATSIKLFQADPSATLDFIKKVQDIQASGFDIPTLNYILTGTSKATDNIAITQDTILQALPALRNSVLQIALNNPESDITIMTAALLSKKLMLLYSKDVANTLLSMLYGSVDMIVSSGIPNNTAFTLPSGLTSKLSIEPQSNITGTLTYTYTPSTGTFNANDTITDVNGSQGSIVSNIGNTLTLSGIVFKGGSVTFSDTIMNLSKTSSATPVTFTPTVNITGTLTYTGLNGGNFSVNDIITDINGSIGVVTSLSTSASTMTLTLSGILFAGNNSTFSGSIGNQGNVVTANANIFTFTLGTLNYTGLKGGSFSIGDIITDTNGSTGEVASDNGSNSMTLLGILFLNGNTTFSGIISIKGNTNGPTATANIFTPPFTLQCIGLLNEADYNTLIGLNPPAPFLKAINDIYNQCQTILNNQVVLKAPVPDTSISLQITGLSSTYSYVNQNGNYFLQCNGIMPHADYNTLINLTPTPPASFLNAINSIHNQPQALILNNFAGVFNLDQSEVFNSPPLIDVLSDLFNTSDSNPLSFSEILQNFYAAYRPFLVKTLQSTVISQAISGLIGINELSVNSLIASNIDNLIYALSATGLSVNYFSDNLFQNQVTPEPTDPDEDVDFNWFTPPTALPPLITNFGVQWQGWICPDTSDNYTFTVNVGFAGETIELWIDGKKIIDNTDNPVIGISISSTNTSWQASLSLTGGKMYSVILKSLESISQAGIHLSWSNSTTNQIIIDTNDTNYLYPYVQINSIIQSILSYQRAALFINGFALTTAELNYFLIHHADFSNIDFQTITPEQFLRIYHYTVLRTTIPATSLLPLFQSAGQMNPTATISYTFVGSVINATKWNKDYFSYLAGNAGNPTVAPPVNQSVSYFGLTASDFKKEKALLKIQKAIKIAAATGMSVSDKGLPGWVEVESSLTSVVLIYTGLGLKEKFIIGETIIDANGNTGVVSADNGSNTLILSGVNTALSGQISGSTSKATANVNIYLLTSGTLTYTGLTGKFQAGDIITDANGSTGMVVTDNGSKMTLSGIVFADGYTTFLGPITGIISATATPNIFTLSSGILLYSGLMGLFQAGDTITDANGSTGVVASDNGINSMTLSNVSFAGGNATFSGQITGTSNATATTVTTFTFTLATLNYTNLSGIFQAGNTITDANGSTGIIVNDNGSNSMTVSPIKFAGANTAFSGTIVASGTSIETPAATATVNIYSTSFDDLHQIALEIQNAVKALHQNSDWQTIGNQLNNVIRDDQKQALISYLINQNLQVNGNTPVTDADGLYEYFLIDVQMEPCMLTSRIIQATMAVQLFAMRCQLGLENNSVSTTTIGAQWSWMQYYSMYAAFKQMCVDVENYLDPSLRDDKTPFFEELESTLFKSDITAQTVEDAYRDYLFNLHEVSNLEVVGMYNDAETQNNVNTSTLHVFARTHSAPYTYYYRTQDVGSQQWSPWEEVPLDIKSIDDGDNSGVHLVPVVWNNRLFLFWPEFSPKSVSMTDNYYTTTIQNQASQPASNLQAQNYWEIRLGWSEYANSKWTNKKLSKEFLAPFYTTWVDFAQGENDIILENTTQENPYYMPQTVQKEFFIESTFDNNNNLILTLWWGFSGPISSGNPLDSFALGTFTLSDIQNKIIVTPNGLTELAIIFSFHNINLPQDDYQNIVSSAEQPFFESFEKTGILNLSKVTFLNSSVNHRNLFSNNLDINTFDNNINNSFFYRDVSNSRTYFVTPAQVSIYNTFKKPVYFPFMPVYNTYSSLSANATTQANIKIAASPNEVEQVTTNVVVSSASPATTSIAINPTRPPAVNMPSSDYNFNYSLAKSTMKVAGGFYLDTPPFAGNLTIVYHPDLSIPGLAFYTFYHPYVKQFINNLNTGGVAGLFLNSENISGDGGSTFVNNYAPTPSVQAYDRTDTLHNYYLENVDFSVSGAYSIYNWELFYHIPMLLGKRLSTNGRYAEAMQWHNYIFNPNSTQKFPFPPFQNSPIDDTTAFFKDLSTSTDLISDWTKYPFDPFVIARSRPFKFMLSTVMAYLDNLIAWGDSLYMVDTRESINLATQIYVMAAQVLGPQPQYVPSRGISVPSSYNSLKSAGLDKFGDAFVNLQNLFPFTSSIQGQTGISSVPYNMLGVGQTLYFCVPPNDQLLQYWTSVGTRLFNIRHCRNINGVQQTLALFQPPLNPALIQQAMAQGLNLGSILADLDAPSPLYRYSYLSQKAKEYCNEVISLSNSLLSACEKSDAEALARMRSTQEITLLNMVTTVKKQQVLDAKSSLDSLNTSRTTSLQKLTHYVTELLGNNAATVPDAPVLSDNLDDKSTLPSETVIAQLSPGPDIALVDSSETGIKVINKENTEMQNLDTAYGFQQTASGLSTLAGMLHLTPDGKLDAMPFGIGAGINFGGSNLGPSTIALSQVAQIVAAGYTHSASQASKMASYIRREQDWVFQANMTAREIIQLDKQIVAAQIKQQIAENELANHLQQIQNAQQVDQFLYSKFSNEELYQWMKGRLLDTLKQSYNLAYGMAKKAELAYQLELGLEPLSTNFIQYGYYISSYNGIGAGEPLQLALNQMENSFIELNVRNQEIILPISLVMFSPQSLLSLSQTGTCTFKIDELFFDLYYPGQYLRTIKSVRISIPCVAGPFTNVSAKLTYQSGYMRQQGNLTSYKGDPVSDNLTDWAIPICNSMIASSGQNDSGMFEFNFRDERYLPFEGAGAIYSQWLLELPAAIRSFDYSTISDIILHISFTAKDDGNFRDLVESNITKVIQSTTFQRLFSMKSDFPDAFYQLVNSINPSTTIILRKHNFPYLFNDSGLKQPTIKSIFVRQRKNYTALLPVPLVTGSENNWTIIMPVIPSSIIVPPAPVIDDILILLNYGS